MLLLFITFSVLVANPKKLLYMVVNPARGLLNGKKKKKVWHTQGQIPEMENLLEELTVKAAIKKVNSQSAAGPSGLRYSHLQAALCDELVEDLAAFATFVVSGRSLPQVF